MLTHGRSRQPNATVLDSSGKELARFWVGDCVEHLQADQAGNVWISYFDEGYGEDYSERGLSCYDGQGQALDPWWYCPMMDCYAMNVSKDGVWHCGYTEFPIVHVGFDRSQRKWDNCITGATAIVGWDRQVTLYGGYQERAQHLTTLRLSTSEQAVVETETVARLPGTQEVPGVIGRGPYFHAVHRGIWYRLDPRNTK
jgi:hypothetical protein